MALIAASPPAFGALSMDAAVVDAASATSIAALAARLDTGKKGDIERGRELLRLASEHGGVFRPDVATQLKELGDAALPALLDAQKQGPLGLRAWAGAQLEAQGKRLASDVVQTKRDDVLVEVLRIYGNTRDFDALAVLLSFANADKAAVRGAARDALGAYGKDASWKLREDYTGLLGKPPDEAWSPEQLAAQLFAALDRVRLREVYAIVDDGFAKLRAGRADEALAAFDLALARQPDVDRKQEIAAAYVDRALAHDEPAAARMLLRRALQIDPESSRKGQIDSLLLTLEADELLARGLADEGAYRRALELDPTNARARTAISRLEGDRQGRDDRLRYGLGVGGALGFVLLVLIVAAPGLRRRAT